LEFIFPPILNMTFN